MSKDNNLITTYTDPWEAYLNEITESMETLLNNIKTNEKEHLKEFENEGYFLVLKTDIKLLEPIDGYADGSLLFMTTDKTLNNSTEFKTYMHEYANRCALKNENIRCSDSDIYTSVAAACYASILDNEIYNAPQFNCSHNMYLVCNRSFKPLVICAYVPCYDSLVVTTEKEMDLK